MIARHSGKAVDTEKTRFDRLRGRWIVLAALAWLQAGPAAAACRAVVEPVGQTLNACMGSERVTIAAVGDVLLHRPLQRRGYADADGFRGIWRAVEPLLAQADIAYANLEGPVAPGITRSRRAVSNPGPVFDDRVYSSFPLFNYHPVVPAALAASGFNLVSTANNHALDRGSLGADLTIAALEAAGLAHTGTIRAGAARDFVTHVTTRLGRVAWIACTYSNNGLPDPHRQVLHCYDDRDEMRALIGAQAARSDVAAVIVTPHWGYEYQHSPNANQRTLAADMVRAGATAVLGTHPHVIQPWDYALAPDGSRSLVVYSTGNFVSGQVTLARRTGVLAMLQLCRQPPARDLAVAMRAPLAVARAGWVPLMMTRTAQGPELVVAGAGERGLAAQARKLAARFLPPGNLRVDVACAGETPPREVLLALQ